MDTADEYCGLTFDLRGNGRKKLLFLGKTGAGKSALCNSLSTPIEETGEFQNVTIFPEVAISDANIGNTCTIMADVNYLGSTQKKVSFIDTVGFDSTEMSNTEIAEFIVKLKESCDFINLFAVVMKSPTRIEDSLKDTLVLFETMFGKDQFWNNVVFIITHLEQSDKKVSGRKKRSIDDCTLMTNLSNQIKRIFELESAESLPFLIIDAHCETDCEDEKGRFEDSTDALYAMLTDDTKKAIPVDNITQAVGKYEGLQDAIKKAENENDQLREKIKRLEEEKEKHLKDAKRAEAKAAKLREQENRARKEAAQLANEAEEAERNAEFEIARRLREQERRTQEEIRRFQEEKRKAEDEAANSRWKYHLACAAVITLLALGTGGAAVAAATGAIDGPAVATAVVGMVDVEAVKAFLTTQVAPRVVPILGAYLKKKLGVE